MIEYNFENNNMEWASAPYNFIPFEKKCVKSVDKLVLHNEFYGERKTGKITYNLENLTELFIGGNKEQAENGVELFFGDEDHFIIPGSTMRGLIRNNAEILSLSYPDMIEDRTMMYRSFADKCVSFRKQYMDKMRDNNERKRMSFHQSVKAGYLFWENEHKLVIVPAKEFEGRGRNFVKVHESDLRKDKILTNEQFYMYTRKINKFSELKDKEGSLRDRENRYKKSIRPYSKRNYVPYGNQPFLSGGQQLSFQYDEARITQLGEGKAKGYLFNSQWIDGKVSHYLVNRLTYEELKASSIKKVIAKDLVASYEKDLERNKQQNKALEKMNFYNLPYEKTGKAIGAKYAKIFFYRTNDKDEVIDFGPTPYFRTFYENSIKKGLLAQKVNYDYVSSLFGFVLEKEESKGDKSSNYQSRVNFMNCLLPKTRDQEAKDCSIVLMNPKPTAFQLYLEQPRNDIRKLKTYEDKFQLRGRKFYWKREHIEQSVESKNKTIETMIRPLRKGNKFYGEIYFENVTEAELGLLLSSLQLESEDKDMIGHGKPYGFGKIQFSNIEVFYEDKRKSFLELEGGYFQAYANDKLDWKYYKNEFFTEIRNVVQEILFIHSNTNEVQTIVRDICEGIFELKNEVSIKSEWIEIEVQEFLERVKEVLTKEDELENVINDSTSVITQKCHNLILCRKMEMKIKELKDVFQKEMEENLKKMKGNKKEYIDLESIQVFKEWRRLDDLPQINRENFSYMELTGFKQRKVLRRANDLL